jgi:hypothetical protein
MKFDRSQSEISEMWTRRNITFGLFVLSALVYSSSGTAEREFALKSDEGSPLDNFRMPVELDPARLPGVLWKGPNTADCIIYEFFDYNCGYCRQAGRVLDRIIAEDPGVRIGLVNYPMLSIGSVQVAKIQQGILRLFGPDVAYAFHIKMLERHGPATGPAALDVARLMELDMRKIEENADSSTIASVVMRQSKLAVHAGMVMTPSFVIAGTVVPGWPGVGSFRDMIAAVRKCDHPACP